MVTLANMINWRGVLFSVFVIAGAIFLIRSTKNIANRLGNAIPERRLYIHKLSTFLQFGLYLVTFIVVFLMSFKISREALVIIGGGAALAFGLALKDLAASVIAGTIIMFDRPFQVGDRVNFGGQYGDITEIGLRSVRLQTLDDNTVTIPNNMFLNGVTSCSNYGVLDMQVVLDFYIAIDQDVNLARDLIREAATDSNYVHLPKSIIVLVSQEISNNHVAIRLRLKAYVLDTKYEKAFESDITLRVLEAFRGNGIRSPAILHRAWSDIHLSSAAHFQPVQK